MDVVLLFPFLKEVDEKWDCAVWDVVAPIFKFSKPPGVYLGIYLGAGTTSDDIS